MYRQIRRFLHVNQPCWSTAKDKSLLGKLRKKTGYTISNCKKALELCNNDIEMAEKWLHEQAQALGWSKAMKLEGRPTAQGLIAVAVDGECGTLVEVNCETDFVARNNVFRSMAETVAKSCLEFTKKQVLAAPIAKFDLSSERLKGFTTDDGKVLADYVALNIGSLGENLMIRRATCVKVGGEVMLTGATHPPPAVESEVLSGKYGALLAFKEDKSLSENKPPQEISASELGRNLCLHVIGMNPSKIGEVGVDEPVDNPDEETCMIHQEYLLDPSMTVSQVLADSGLSLTEFIRYECGEDLSAPSAQPVTDLALEVGG